ncbi:FecR domain-containing protein [Bradyrhizobium sp. 147]|uniref:FecR domain-containing protein n=1 Tax=unclassified Bradyrhizobium TaxID=2631580 RepID=UPI001FFBA088|nr:MULTISPECIES: FecR domain-containing protein [unclassified Bradyrhizobium]MCK1541587.1 FecR domain-containing protein [Bradyrhizobium sp. 179]MCK1624181.1 FecR domain-containing protein [Bradyrhizobium sp. 160]MCK1681277.1 FecR domain-containing protein [Bradyrhizobium sp. 147]
MRGFSRAGFCALACLLLLIGFAKAQSAANAGCTASPSAAGTQVWRCDNGITIVAENGARFELKDANRDGHIDSVELSSKALLIEVPKKPGGNPFKVLTPQAIAAVRGTKWAVDVADAKTSVFVAGGRVGVTRRARGRGVVLGPGEGVDVEATGPLTVKTWGQPRVDALMARLGQ